MSDLIRTIKQLAEEMGLDTLVKELGVSDEYLEREAEGISSRALSAYFMCALFYQKRDFSQISEPVARSLYETLAWVVDVAPMLTKHSEQADPEE